MIRVIALYGNPTDPDAFELHYAQTHTPLVVKLPHLKRFDVARVVASPGQSTPAFYRSADLWFEDVERYQAAMASPAGQAIADDIVTFATGGLTLLVSESVQML